MDRLEINIAKDFSRTPGPRTKSEGLYSAEDFMDKILRKKFELAVNKGVKLVIDLDYTAGYATSFLEGSFGQLQRDNPNIEIDKFLELISEEDPYLIEEILEYVNEARQ